MAKKPTPAFKVVVDAADEVVAYGPNDENYAPTVGESCRLELLDAVPVAAIPAPVRVVSMRQARLALLSMGLLDDVETAIGLLPEPQKSAAKIEWEYATEVRSDNPTVALLAEAIELDLDQLFDIAEGIQ